MFKIGDKDVDLSKAMPLTIGDMKALKKAGLDLARMRPGTDLDSDQVLAMIEHVVMKANPAVTVADLDATPITALATISAEIQEKMTAGDSDPSL